MVQILWPPCDVCGKRTHRSTGRLVLNGEEVDEYWEGYYAEQTELYQLNKRTEQQGLGEPKLEDIPVGPSPVTWHWGHSRCLPKSEYMISAHRLDTVGKMLALTLDQTEDDYYPRTTWREALARFHVLS